MIEAATTKYAEVKAAQFKEKSLILNRRFRKLPPQFYLDELFFGSHEYRLANFAASPSGQRIRTYESAEEMLKAAADRSDAFYYPSDFLSERPYPRRKLLKSMYALIVDLDGVSPKAAKYIADANFFGIIPTYLINSGGGLHLVFAFDEPVECYDWTKALLNRMYTKLKKFFKRSSRQYIVDEGIGLLHAFRLPGTLTKYGCICEAYRTGESWTAKKLAAAMKMAWKTSPEPLSKKVSNALPKNAEQPNAHDGFYKKAKQRMLEETPVGNRYLSMFALSIIAYKCSIPRTVLEEDLETIRLAYNNRDRNAHTVRTGETAKAIKGYNPKATLVKRTTLNEWMGFEFEPAKRNGLSRKEHIAKVNADRSSKARETVEEYFRRNPLESNAKAARDLGMSRNTVRKYRPAESGQKIITVAESLASSPEKAVPASNNTASSSGLQEKAQEQGINISASIVEPCSQPAVLEHASQHTVSDTPDVPAGSRSVCAAPHQIDRQGLQTPVSPLTFSQRQILRETLQKPRYRRQFCRTARSDITCIDLPVPPKLLVQRMPLGLDNPANFAVCPKLFFRQLQYLAATCTADADDYDSHVPDIIASFADGFDDDEEPATPEDIFEYAEFLRHDADAATAYFRSFCT